MILKEIGNSDEIDLSKLVEICDLYKFLPMKKFKDRNDSRHLYMVMSSNTRESHSHSVEDQGGFLKRMLDMLWQKIYEKYSSIHEAYRYFDVNFNNRVNFSEF